MAQTIPGGAYRTAAGWVDAKGEELTKAQIATATELLSDQQNAKAEAEQQRLLLEAQSNPAARAIAMLTQSTPVRPEHAEKDRKKAENL
jgi:hypothetical protein